LEIAANEILKDLGHCSTCDNSDADDLEAMARIIEEAAKIYGDEDLEGFLNGLSQVFNGV